MKNLIKIILFVLGVMMVVGGVNMINTPVLIAGMIVLITVIYSLVPRSKAKNLKTFSTVLLSAMLIGYGFHNHTMIWAFGCLLFIIVMYNMINAYVRKTC